MDWLDFLAVQGTLKSLLQHHSFQKPQFFDIQPSFGPTLTHVRDYRKDYSFDYTDLDAVSKIRILQDKGKYS